MTPRVAIVLMVVCLTLLGTSMFLLLRGGDPEPEVSDTDYPVLGGEDGPRAVDEDGRPDGVEREGVRRNADPASPDPGLEGLGVVDFAMVDQDGDAVDQGLLDGRLTVLDFVFTNCPTFCPGMTKRMSELQDSLGDTDVRFVSISVDPVRDTPEALRTWGDEYGADFGSWSFLTGDEEAMLRVAEGLRLYVGEDRNTVIQLGGDETMFMVSHPIRFALIDGERRLLGLYRYNDRGELASLESRVRAILGNAPRGDDGG